MGEPTVKLGEHPARLVLVGLGEHAAWRFAVTDHSARARIVELCEHAAWHCGLELGDHSARLPSRAVLELPRLELAQVGGA